MLFNNFFDLAGGFISFGTYIDGITEAENTEGEPFGKTRLAEVVKATAPQGSAEHIKDGIVAALDDFVGDLPPFDDRTFLIIRYQGS